MAGERTTHGVNSCAVVDARAETLSRSRMLSGDTSALEPEDRQQRCVAREQWVNTVPAWMSKVSHGAHTALVIAVGRGCHPSPLLTCPQGAYGTVRPRVLVGSLEDRCVEVSWLACLGSRTRPRPCGP